jgi:hypothetical protein
MSDPPVPASSPRRILALARQDRNAARRELAGLSVDEQVALVCESPLAARGELLGLLPLPEAVVPALPEAELCFTAKAIGLADAGWLLAHASAEQLVACVDLDAWSPLELVPDRERLGAWLALLADSGEPALLRGALALDAELLVLWLKERIEVWLKPSDSEGDWEAPPGAQTLEGQFFFRARRAGDDLSEVRAVLDAIFREEYWTYFRLLQGVVWELEAEIEEWSLRWRQGRLLDLGFPDFEEAAALYAVVPARALDELEERAAPRDSGALRLPIWMPRLPVSERAAHSLLRALASLPAHEREPLLFSLLLLANRIAVADRLSLGDAESIPLALDKAIRGTSRGIDHLAAARGVSAAEVLRRASLERLFRVGFTLAPELGPPARPSEAEAAGRAGESEAE